MSLLRQCLLCSLLAALALGDIAAAAAVESLTLGMLTQSDTGTYYLYHLSLNATVAESTAVTPASNDSTILFVNNNVDEDLMFSPPQGSNTEWLIPLDNDSGGMMVHYNVSSQLLQIDQVHGGLRVGPYVDGDIQQIVWLEQQQSFLGVTVDQDYVLGELYLDFYANMVDELQRRYPRPVDNITLSLGKPNEFFLEKQTMAVSQKQQRLFFMPGVWNQPTNRFYAAVWVYDIANMSVSEPVGYRNDSSTTLFTSTLVFSEQRDALYAVVGLAQSGVLLQLLVDRIDWTTGAVTHITKSIPVPKAGLLSLRAALDDASGDIYVTSLSIAPNVAGYVVLINTVNVDTGAVTKLAELPSMDIPLGVALTASFSESGSERRAPRRPVQHAWATPSSASAARLDLSKRTKFCFNLLRL